MADGAQHNVLFVATMHNTVYAFDAGFDSATGPGRPLWQVTLGASVPSAILYGPYGDIANEVGILGTGAIDPQRGVLFVMADRLLNGVPQFQLHALDLTTGQERLNGPAVVKMSSGGVNFDPLQHIQRTGLLLANGSVYAGFGSHGDQAPWHGWIVSYDAGDLSRQNGVFLSTPSGNGGAFWRNIIADSSGTLYSISGNGDYDGKQNVSQSFLKLTGAAPARTGLYTPPDWESMSDADFDLSAGPELIESTHTLIGADKAGNIYVVDANSMDQASAPPPDASARFQASSGAIFSIATWDLPGGALVFAQGSRDNLRSYRVGTTASQAAPVAASAAVVTYSRIGMTLSADGSDLTSGVVWETDGNFNDDTAPGVLHAYQASDLTELWNSGADTTDAMGPVSKFAAPTVADGRVFVPTFGGGVVVYGFKAQNETQPPAITTVASAASYQQDAIAPGEMVAIFGSHLGPVSPAGLTLDSDGNVSTSVAQTRVLFDGVAAPIVYASDTQVNAIVPAGITAQSTQVSVEYQGQASAPVQIAMSPTIPGIFSADASGAGQAIALNQDGTVNSLNQPAAPGSVVVLYATGTGLLSPSPPDGSVIGSTDLPQSALPVSAQVGGIDAQVLYAGGAPGLVSSVLQVNLQIPESAPPGSVVVQIGAGGRNSPSTLTLAVGGTEN